MKRIYVLVCLAVLAGCAHSAPQDAPKSQESATTKNVKEEKPVLSVALLEKNIVKGKTKKEELLAKIGAPNSITKNPYHVPNIKTPGFNIKVPPEMMAVETWNYWTIIKYSPDNLPKTALGVEIYIDETGVALDYKATEKDVSTPPGM